MKRNRASECIRISLSHRLYVHTAYTSRIFRFNAVERGTRSTP